MLLIPEIETVVILVPRTASTSIKTAVLALYPKAMQIYRHMEADGVPHGYDRWPKVGVVRHPFSRLWSLYKFLKTFDGPYPPHYLAAQRASVDKSFSDWILQNQTVFTSPFDTAGTLKYWPGYCVRHPMPENRKSQFHYLRPDLGTEIFHFADMPRLEKRLGIKLPELNGSVASSGGLLSQDAAAHMASVFEWDYRAVGAVPPA